MNRKTFVAALSVIVLGVGMMACGGGGGAESSQVAEGHKLFKGTCAACHGQNGEGMPKLGKDLHNNEFTKGLSDVALVQFLKDGRSATHPDNERGVDMPPNGGNPTFTDADLTLIVAYVRTLQ